MYRTTTASSTNILQVSLLLLQTIRILLLPQPHRWILRQIQIQKQISMRIRPSPYCLITNSHKHERRDTKTISIYFLVLKWTKIDIVQNWWSNFTNLLQVSFYVYGITLHLFNSIKLDILVWCYNWTIKYLNNCFFFYWILVGVY